jgi:hypothetical protein
MLRVVALVRTDVSEELSTSIIRVTGIGELGTTLAVTSNRRTLLCFQSKLCVCGGSLSNNKVKSWQWFLF